MCVSYWLAGPGCALALILCAMLGPVSTEIVCSGQLPFSVLLVDRRVDVYNLKYSTLYAWGNHSFALVRDVETPTVSTVLLFIASVSLSMGFCNHLL
jgi:hypothetical protein